MLLMEFFFHRFGVALTGHKLKREIKKNSTEDKVLVKNTGCYCSVCGESTLWRFQNDLKWLLHGSTSLFRRQSPLLVNKISQWDVQEGVGYAILYFIQKHMWSVQTLGSACNLQKHDSSNLSISVSCGMEHSLLKLNIIKVYLTNRFYS